MSVVTRRDVLALGGLGALALALPAWAEDGIRLPPATTELVVSPTRRTTMTTWPAYKPRGVVLFSHGHGSWPERYALLGDLLSGYGYTVMAPLHVDSMHYPERAAFTRGASFGERIADLNAALAVAQRLYPGQPVGAVGHSFGTLTALCLGGGLGTLGRFRQSAVKAVVGFSTPGNVPGLVGPTAYTGVETPVMIVSGTADTVPGLVTDSADHLLAVRTAKAAPRYGLMIGGGGHELVADPAQMARVSTPVALFLAATLRGDAPARRRLADYRLDAPDQFLVEAR